MTVDRRAIHVSQGRTLIFALLRRLRHGSLKRLDPLWLPLGRLYRWLIRLGGRQTAASHSIGGYGPFRLDGYFAFSDFAHWGGGHNAGFAACVEACRGRRAVIDVGAHVGLVTLPVASVLGQGGLVVAFEPAAANRRFLERHVALNGFSQRVRVEGMLLGDSEQEAVVFFEVEEATGMSTVASGVLRGEARRTMLPQTSLDAYCQRAQLVPEVVKIDVEGAEIAVLEGARQVLADCRPTVFLSVHPRLIAALGRSTDDLTKLIAEVGYECRNIDGTPVATFALREYVLRPQQ